MEVEVEVIEKHTLSLDIIEFKYLFIRFSRIFFVFHYIFCINNVLCCEYVDDYDYGYLFCLIMMPIMMMEY